MWSNAFQNRSFLNQSACSGITFLFTVSCFDFFQSVFCLYEALRELLHSELKNKTIVFITHKYKELESVDKVYRLSKGILELVRS